MSIKTENLSFYYNKGTPLEKKALNRVNISVEKGEIAGVIGHTGSGKSTLIQHFNALLIPSEGRVFFCGEPINAREKAELVALRQRVGLVFQYPEHQLFETTVFKDVAFGLKLRSEPESLINEKVKKALNAVGLGEEFFEKSPFDLSGGEKRRVAIAGALATEPEALILDEPAAGLDPAHRNALLGQIVKMRDETGITVILVSHSMDDIARFADKIFVMSNGEVVLSGAPREVFSKHAYLTQIGLDAPQITRLLLRLNERGFNIDPFAPFTAAAAAKAIMEAF